MDITLLIALVLFIGLIVCWVLLPATAITESATKSESEAMPLQSAPLA